MAKVYYLHSCWWEDAYSSCEWISLEEAIKTLPKICYTQGILLEKNKDCHIFTMTFLIPSLFVTNGFAIVHTS